MSPPRQQRPPLNQDEVYKRVRAMVARTRQTRIEELVELARICSDPRSRWATRVTLRLWREVAARTWPSWTPKAAVSYSKNSDHKGDIYRFDGWEKVREDCGSSGGGAWSRKRYAEDAVYGPKTLWLWRYA